MTHLEELEALGRHVARQEDALAPSPEEHERLRAAIVDRALSPPSRSGFAARHWAIGISAAAAVLGALSFVYVRHAPEPLSFFVGPREERGTVGSWISAQEGSALPVRFSDGTRASLLPKGRARVVGVTPFGASVVVESGNAQFDVVPRPNGEWRVNTGPFVVHVTGTRFEVEWHPDRDTFALELYEGHVSISGCNLDNPYPIRAGERVEASCGRREFRVAPIESVTASAAGANGATGRSDGARLTLEAPPASTAPAAQESVTAGRGPMRARPSSGAPASTATPAGDTARVPGPSGAAPGASNADFEDRWVDLAKRGLYADAFAAAEERGFDQERERRGAAEVLLLGDAARFSGHADRARLAYQSVRQRFPGTPSAALAAFQLGRDDFDRRSDFAGAERWLRVYLEEAQGGALAPAAMGRLMEAELRQGNRAEARTLAATYLERFPKGPHAEAAHRVLGAATDDANR